MNEELLPIGTRVILTDVFHASGLQTEITGYDSSDHELPYYVRARGRDNYPASPDEVTVATKLSRAEALKNLTKQAGNLWGDLNALSQAIKQQGQGGVTTDLISDAMGALARAKRELADAAGQAWVNE